MPSKEEYKKLETLLQLFMRAEDYCRPYFDRAKRNYRLYRSGTAVDEKDWPYVNRVRTKDILAFVEDTTALLISTLFATTPFFSVIPRETKVQYILQTGIDTIKVAEQMEKCLDYQISHEDTEFFEEITDFFKGGTIFGNSYIGVYPKFTEEGFYLRPKLDTVDFWNLLPVPGARRMSRARGVFVRELTDIVTLGELAKKGIYQNVDKIKTLQSMDPETDWHAALLQEIGMEEWLPERDQVEVLHYFSNGHLISIADRRVFLRDSTSKGKPFPYDLPQVQYKYMPVPLEFFAMGIPEVLEVLQEDKNLIRSARRDNIDLVINKIIKAREGADINYDLLKFYAGAIWPLENLNDIDVLDIPDVTQSSYAEEQGLQRDMENALSLFGYARGQTPAHSEQPTTVMKIQQASLNRLDLAVKMAEFTTLQNIAARIIMLNRAYMTQENYEAIIGEPDAGFYQMTVEDVKKFFTIKPVGSSISNIKEVRQKQIETMIGMLSQFPPEVTQGNVTPFAVDWYETLMTGLDSIDIKNKDRVLIKLQQEEQPMDMDLGNVPYGAA